MSNGTAVNIPNIGLAYEPGKLYVQRVAIGYGATDNSAGGASDGLDLWTDTQETISAVNVNSSDVVIHGVQYMFPTAFTAAVNINLGPSTGNTEFGDTTEVAATEARYLFYASTAAADTGVALGWIVESTTTIDFVIGGADVAAGIGHFYFIYSIAPPALASSLASSNT